MGPGADGGTFRVASVYGNAGVGGASVGVTQGLGMPTGRGFPGVL